VTGQNTESDGGRARKGPGTKLLAYSDTVSTSLGTDQKEYRRAEVVVL